MQVLQWTMTIPADKQPAFTKWFKEVGGPGLGGFGAIQHELYKMEREDKFVERIYFDNDFNIPDYFAQVKANPETWKLSRTYEGEFGATNIELKILKQA
ncbi:MAG: hypothetical protein UX80_C0004G0018 [Candidatus Amesbacteria bacterium GW2011_GWA2_47_11b]|uniref:NIPSNAP domain-containing protein n=2 Tax=Candidatus Amesiibacteriota TaxID=1752730 RepID=A0A0G1SHJ0_9BACT|nr:MAG: hypothetical protein UX42_C0012G0010 [Microgenomates group bacterium GW2011_GWC1_46_20]KKU58267.1 MAG: hypothetical protein UX80_C0004G0018 [Candidatus Amesbacteria bacterium GW2011_GWA2_47_11b]KKU68904.1 MAG: hypothetical protein UX92_C0017G0011 [Candidatus Amesbacteria bacterium GW2011_GWA1_47_20]